MPLLLPKILCRTTYICSVARCDIGGRSSLLLSSHVPVIFCVCFVNVFGLPCRRRRGGGGDCTGLFVRAGRRNVQHDGQGLESGQSVSQSANQSFRRPVTQSISQPVCLSVGFSCGSGIGLRRIERCQSVSQSISRSISHSVSKSVNDPIIMACRSVQRILVSVSQSVRQSTCAVVQSCSCSGQSS